MAKLKDFKVTDVNKIIEELDLTNVNQSDMSALNSSFLQYGVITYNSGDTTGKLELLIGGKAYSFPSFPIAV